MRSESLLSGLSLLEGMLAHSETPEFQPSARRPADALREIGIRADFVPSQFVAESVVEEWPDKQMIGKRALIPRAREARDFLPDKLRELGAAVDIEPVYETLLDADAADEIRAELVSGAIDILTFTSSFNGEELRREHRKRKRFLRLPER